jgi:uncharacterized protein YndB with AHSA1/START domain
MTTQIHRIYIHATPQAVWDAITKPEWSERYGMPRRWSTSSNRAANSEHMQTPV